MASGTDVIGYTYDADVHCLDCAEEFGATLDDARDSAGNTPHPIFAIDEAGGICDECDGEGQHTCRGCGCRHDCGLCDGTGRQPVCCGDCGQELG